MKISTITVCAKVGSKLNLIELIKDKKIEEILKLRKESYFSRDIPTHKFKKENIANAPRTFFNSVNLKLNGTSVKIFSNGSMQITGIKQPEDIQEIPKLVADLISECPLSIIEPCLFKLKDVKIAMIRIYSSVGSNINLTKMKDFINDIKITDNNSNWISAIYLPERSAGLIAKYEDKEQNEIATLIMFQTGKYSIISKNFETINKINNFLIN